MARNLSSARESQPERVTVNAVNFARGVRAHLRRLRVPERGREPLSSLLGAPGARVSFGEGMLEALSLDRRAAQFELSVSMAQHGSELFGVFEYATDLFRAETIQKMAARFAYLLSELARKPEQRLSELSVVLPSEREVLLEKFNDTARDYPLEQCLHHLVERQVATTPEATPADMLVPLNLM
jgi:hypothetical protein